MINNQLLNKKSRPSLSQLIYNVTQKIYFILNHEINSLITFTFIKYSLRF